MTNIKIIITNGVHKNKSKNNQNGLTIKMVYIYFTSFIVLRFWPSELDVNRLENRTCMGILSVVQKIFKQMSNN